MRVSTARLDLSELRSEDKERKEGKKKKDLIHISIEAIRVLKLGAEGTRIGGDFEGKF